MAAHRDYRYRSDELRLERMVYGQRFAAEAWRLFWDLYRRPHVIEAELWSGPRMVLRAVPGRLKG